jgi:hypothetical protein
VRGRSGEPGSNWSQPGEKVIRFEDSMERARRRFDEVLADLNLNAKELDGR